MKGIGNYRNVPPSMPAVSTERRLAQVALFRGPRASVRFIDGTTYSIPSEPLHKLGIAPGGMFVLIIEYRGRDVSGYRVERQPAARGAAPARPTQPKVMIRDGLKVTTRR